MISAVHIYSMSGIPIAADMNKQGDVLSFNVGKLPVGTYMVRATNLAMSSSWTTFLVSH